MLKKWTPFHKLHTYKGGFFRGQSFCDSLNDAPANKS